MSALNLMDELAVEGIELGFGGVENAQFVLDVLAAATVEARDELADRVGKKIAAARLLAGNGDE